MKLNKFAYLYSIPLGNHTLKIMKKIPGNLLKNLEKSWKYHGILSVRKSGNPVSSTYTAEFSAKFSMTRSDSGLFEKAKFQVCYCNRLKHWVISFHPFIPPANEAVGRCIIVCLSVCHSVEGDLCTGPWPCPLCTCPPPRHSVQVKAPFPSRRTAPYPPTCSNLDLLYRSLLPR